MSNSYYIVSGTPATGSPGASSPVRSEFALIAAGFNLLPTLSVGAAGCAIVLNGSGTALTTTAGQLTLAGNLTTTGAFATSLTQQASVTLTLPAVNGTLATLAGTETLTNKTVTAPVLSGTVTGTYTLGGTPTITAPTITGTAAASKLTLNGASIGSDVLAVTGTATFSGTVKVGSFNCGTATNTLPAGSAIFGNESLSVNGTTNKVQTFSGGGYYWTSTSHASDSTLDTGISRTGAAAIAFGNGTQGDVSAALSAASLALSSTLSIGNSLNSVSPTSPNRTITMVVGGVTVYLAAKTTND